MTQALEVHNGNNAIARRRTVMGELSERYSMEPAKLLDTIKATCIKGNASNEQVQAFLIVANRYGLDPFLKQIHAFADSRSGGIVPIVGIDGWTKIINEQDRFDGMDEPRMLMGANGKPESCTVTIYVKGRSHPVTITEYFEECHRNTPPWNGMPRRMLRHKTIMQCARIAFGLGGIYDEDEARDIIDGVVVKTGKLDAKLAARKALPDTQLPEHEVAEVIESLPPEAAEPVSGPITNTDAAQAGGGEEPDVPEAEMDVEPNMVAVNGINWPLALKDHSKSWIDDAVTALYPRDKFSSGIAAKKAFHALDVNSWAALTPERRAEKYGQLLHGELWK